MSVKVSCCLLLLTVVSVSLVGCSTVTGGQLATADSAGESSSAASFRKPGPHRQFVYVANLGSLRTGGGGISGFSLDPHSGKLTPVAGSPFLLDSNPAVITAGPSGHHLFVLEKRFSSPGEPCTHIKGELLLETVHPHSGALSPAQKITLDGSCPDSAVVDGSGKFLYVAMLTTDGVSLGKPLGEIQIFAIGSGGRLSEIPQSPVWVSQPLQTLALHPEGKLLFAATADDRNGILVFQRDPKAGILGIPAIAAVRPQSAMAFVAGGNFMIADTPANVDQVSLFRIDKSTGNLALQFTTAAVTPWGISVDPSGTFAAIAITQPSPGAPGEVLIYRINPNSGSLTQLATPVTAGSGSFAVRFAPNGRFVYTTAINDDSVSGFAFDPDTGALAPLPDSPFHAGKAPIDLVIVNPK